MTAGECGRRETFRRTPITADPIDAGSVRVTAGLHGGDRVVVDGALGLDSPAAAAAREHTWRRSRH